MLRGIYVTALRGVPSACKQKMNALGQIIVDVQRRKPSGRYQRRDVKNKVQQNVRSIWIIERFTYAHFARNAVRTEKVGIRSANWAPIEKSLVEYPDAIRVGGWRRLLATPCNEPLTECIQFYALVAKY